jgi:hypothetical protein
LGGARQMMVDEYNRPQVIGTSSRFQPTGLVNRQKYSPEDYRLDVTVPEVEREDEDDPSDPPPPPPDQKVGWKPPPGYMEGPILRPRTDEEIDPAALYGGTQGQLPYNAVATEDEVDIAALMGGTQGQLPYGAVATDDPRDATNWADWAGLGDMVARTRVDEPFDQGAAGDPMSYLSQMVGMDKDYGISPDDMAWRSVSDIPLNTKKDDDRGIDPAQIYGSTQGQIPMATDQDRLPLVNDYESTQGRIPMRLTPEEEGIKADLAAWQAIAPSSYTRTDDTYSRQGINGNDAALAAYGAQGGPPELSIYGQEALLGPGMAMSAYNLPNMSMGFRGGGSGPSGSGGDGGEGGLGTITEEMGKFAFSNPQIMGKANLVPAQYTQFIEANTGVPTRGMSTIQFDDWMNGNDVVVQGEVIPYDPKLVAEIRSSEGAEDALSVLSRWAAQHRQDEYKRQGGALGAASGPIDIGMDRSSPETSEVGGERFSFPPLPSFSERASLTKITPDDVVDRELDGTRKYPDVDRFFQYMGRFPTDDEWTDLYEGRTIHFDAGEAIKWDAGYSDSWKEPSGQALSDEEVDRLRARNGIG